MDTAAGKTSSEFTNIQCNKSWIKLCETIYKNINNGVIITDAAGIIRMVNPAFTVITGYSAEEAVGRNPSFLKSGLHTPKFYEQMWDSIRIIGQWQGEIHNRRKDGSIYPEYLNIISIKSEDDDLTTRYVGIFTDLTLRKDSDEFLKYIATHDVLTNLHNRSSFYDFLNNAIYNYDTRVSRYKFGVLFIDLDNFKTVNDTYGHETGDQLLQAVADRLVETVPASAIVSRLGGDEFTIILNEISTPADASHTALSILEALSQSLDLEEIRVEISASVGISIYPGDGENAESLLQCADQAMYRVKRSGKNGYGFFFTE